MRGAVVIAIGRIEKPGFLRFSEAAACSYRSSNPIAKGSRLQLATTRCSAAAALFTSFQGLYSPFVPPRSAHCTLAPPCCRAAVHPPIAVNSNAAMYNEADRLTHDLSERP